LRVSLVRGGLVTLRVSVPIIGLLGIAAAGALRAEEPNRAQLLEEEKRRVLDQLADESQDLDWDVGGWIRPEYISFDDEPYNAQRSLGFYDLRLWGSVRLADVHRFYARGLLQYSDYKPGDQYRTRENDWRGPNLDQGYYEIDLAGAAPGLGMTSLTGRAGRQFFQVGRGIVMNATMDGVQVSGEGGGFGVKLLGSRIITSTDDIDQSRPDPDDSNRLFYGAEVSLAPTPRSRLYAYGLVQRDHGEGGPGSPGGRFRYNSEYWGLGWSVEPASSLRVRSEFVYETGTTYPEPFTVLPGDSLDKDSIRAQGFDMLVEIHPELPLQARFSLEYMLGSGDPDRGSVTNTLNGNAAGTTDKGFLPFGYVNTGLSLFPRLSNLHIFRFGAAAAPFGGGPEWLRNLDVAVDGFIYRKVYKASGISDLRAGMADAEVGAEVDLTLAWRVLSDVLVELRYGLFLPGSAYPGTMDDVRGFLTAAVTYIF
jgi:hypothetical protein